MSEKTHIQPSSSLDTNQNDQIKQATESIITLFNSRIQPLDAIATSQWKQMTRAEAETSIARGDLAELKDEYRREHVELTRTIEELRRKLKQAEKMIEERDAIIEGLREAIGEIAIVFGCSVLIISRRQ